jgi:hypothetical protein
VAPRIGYVLEARPTATAGRLKPSGNWSGPPDPVTPPGERCVLPKGPIWGTARSYWCYAYVAGVRCATAPSLRIRPRAGSGGQRMDGPL